MIEQFCLRDAFQKICFLFISLFIFVLFLFFFRLLGPRNHLFSILFVSLNFEVFLYFFLVFSRFRKRFWFPIFAMIWTCKKIQFSRFFYRFSLFFSRYFFLFRSFSFSSSVRLCCVWNSLFYERGFVCARATINSPDLGKEEGWRNKLKIWEEERDRKRKKESLKLRDGINSIWSRFDFDSFVANRQTDASEMCFLSIGLCRRLFAEDFLKLDRNQSNF